MDEKTETDTKKKEKRIDLSLAQVSGSALAAAVAAYLAGQLGVYGTIIGAGVVSVVATTGGSIFQHLFRRTGEQIKEAAVTTRPKPRSFSTTRPRSTTGQAESAGPTTVLPTFDRQGAEDTVTSVAARKPDPAAARTQLIPRAEQARRRDPAGAHPADDPTRLLRTVDRDATRAPHPAHHAGRAGATDGTDRTQLVPRLDERTVALAQAAPQEAAATAVLPQTDGPGATVAGDEERTATYGTRLRGWKRPALGALAVFVLAMGAVTATEWFTGETPSGTKGTTVGNLTTGFVPHRPGTPTPTPGHSSGSGRDGSGGTPSPGPSRSGDTGTGSGTGRDTPSPSPTPSDGGSGSPSPGASSSPNPSPSRSTGTGGSGDGANGGATPGHQQSQHNPDTQQTPDPKTP
ncbi:hypothetical protein GCM10010211_10060 [Streptomyces albospinus]|uniref:Uncharacterized protein n=1 Tax=Streptomyces albospinus TaxID=285515 RepID=A0ABQ2UPT9_9ACTN|nr:hypothetical protein [Streptomyces albospinus]GGU47891.1 hypothetical protein GCM10010211_10060 [Streptomyces albospinus]